MRIRKALRVPILAFLSAIVCAGPDVFPAEKAREIPADELIGSVFGAGRWRESSLPPGTHTAESPGSSVPPPPAVDEARRRELEERFASLSRSLGGLPEPPKLQGRQSPVRMPFPEEAEIGLLPGESLRGRRDSDQ